MNKNYHTHKDNPEWKKKWLKKARDYYHAHREEIMKKMKWKNNFCSLINFIHENEEGELEMIKQFLYFHMFLSFLIKNISKILRKISDYNL